LPKIQNNLCQSGFKILPNTKYTFKSLPKIFESLPLGQNFAQSGHTVIDADDDAADTFFEKWVNLATFVVERRRRSKAWKIVARLPNGK